MGLFTCYESSPSDTVILASVLFEFYRWKIAWLVSMIHVHCGTFVYPFAYSTDHALPWARSFDDDIMPGCFYSMAPT